MLGAEAAARLNKRAKKNCINRGVMWMHHSKLQHNHHDLSALSPSFSLCCASCSGCP